MKTFIQLLISLCIALSSLCAHAITAADLKTLADADNSGRIEMIQSWVSKGDAETAKVLQYFYDGELALSPDGKVLRVTDTATTDPLTGANLPMSADAERLTLNNRVRVAIEAAMAGLKLVSPDPQIRLAAAKELQSRAVEDQLPLIEARIKVETDRSVRAVLVLTQAMLSLQNQDSQIRLAAAKTLGESQEPDTKLLLEDRLKPDAETDPAVRAALQESLKNINQLLFTGEMIGHVFSGISLASILLLAALGLAITYGLLGIIFF